MNKQSLHTLIAKLTQVKLHNYQLDFMESCMSGADVLGVFCRQTGKSTCVAIYAALFMLEKPAHRIVIVAPSERQSTALYEKIRSFFNTSPILKNYIAKDTIEHFELTNGSWVKVLPTGPTGANILGFTADLIIFEEAPRIKEKIVNEVVLPMGLSTNAQTIKIGTPFGMNHFYESYMDKENWKVHQYDYTYALKAGQISQAQVDKLRKRLTIMQFRAELGAEFIPDQDTYFKSALVKSCIDEDLPLLSSPRPGRSYILGFDPADVGQDRSVMVIIEEGLEDAPHKVVYSKEFEGAGQTELYDFICLLHEQWNFRRILIDETGVGTGIVAFLARKYNPLQSHESLTSFSHTYQGTDTVLGVKFTQQSKIDLYSNALVLMENRQVKYPNIPELVYELMDFRYEKEDNKPLKLTHPPGHHDDYVAAFALACRGVVGGGQIIISWGSPRDELDPKKRDYSKREPGEEQDIDIQLAELRAQAPEPEASDGKQ